MTRRTLPLIALACIASTTGCGSCTSEADLDTFASADRALTDTVLAASDQLDSKYEHLRAMACSEGRVWADSVNILYERASERMFALDELLTGPAVVGNDKPADPFHEDGLAAEALKTSLALYDLMEQVTVSDSAEASIAETARPLRSVEHVNAWYHRDFRQAPPPSITATIERYVADMGRAKRLCIAELLMPCDHER